jgi:hypothetical protein
MSAYKKTVTQTVTFTFTEWFAKNSQFKKPWMYILVLMLCFTKGYAWNMLGHRLVAQVAYDQMSKEARKLANRYNAALNKVFYPPQNFVSAAAWLDRLHGPKYYWLLEKHYIDIPFSSDGTALRPTKKNNAVLAIEQASTLLRSKTENDVVKGFNLRIILHVVADLHQPLHASNQFSQTNPDGDKGGNLFFLGKNPIAPNLHSYWDRGGGYLMNDQLKKMAQTIEANFPCDPEKMNLNPRVWAEESHRLAVRKVYKLQEGQSPQQRYQTMTQKLTEKRIALAACRLAALLNQLCKESITAPKKRVASPPVTAR